MPQGLPHSPDGLFCLALPRLCFCWLTPLPLPATLAPDSLWHIWMCSLSTSKLTCFSMMERESRAHGQVRFMAICSVAFPVPDSQLGAKGNESTRSRGV